MPETVVLKVCGITAEPEFRVGKSKCFDSSGEKDAKLSAASLYELGVHILKGMAALSQPAEVSV